MYGLTDLKYQMLECFWDASSGVLTIFSGCGEICILISCQETLPSD